jgi:hypothetical protein
VFFFFFNYKAWTLAWPREGLSTHEIPLSSGATTAPISGRWWQFLETTQSQTYSSTIQGLPLVAGSQPPQWPSRGRTLEAPMTMSLPDLQQRHNWGFPHSLSQKVHSPSVKSPRCTRGSQAQDCLVIPYLMWVPIRSSLPAGGHP